MDTKSDREWQRRIREAEYGWEDAKRFRRIFTLVILALSLFTGAWIMCAVLVNVAFLWGLLVTFWAAVGMCYWGNGEEPYDTVRAWKRKIVQLREDYAYATMEGE